MEQEALGIGGSVDRQVCKDHIDDDAITRFISTHTKKGVCDYCKAPKRVIPVDDLMVFIMQGINRVLKDAAEFMSYDSSEGGYLGETFDADDIFSEVLHLDISNYALQQDIEHCIADKAWARDDWDNYAERLNSAWSNFKYVIKHQSRYMFSRTTQFKDYDTGDIAYGILSQIGQIVKKYKLYSIIPEGTSLYRCRQHKIAEVLDKAGQLASPPLEIAVHPNRMSPAGVSMFYGAFDLDTAKGETINESDTHKRRVTSAIFQPKKDLAIIDFTKLPTLPSIFDSKRFKEYYPIAFLKDFVKDLSTPITRDGHPHIEYVPTQVVTEYFRFTFAEEQGLPIDGIVYPSSRMKGRNACVLFMDHRGSLDRLTFIAPSLRRDKVQKTDPLKGL